MYEHRQIAAAVGSSVSAAAASPASGLSWGDSLYDRLLAQRIIVLGQEVNDEIGNKLCAQMLLLAAEDPTADISMYVNSPGKRYALPNAEILMHQPLGGVGGSAADITIQADRLRRLKAKMAELIAGFSGQTPEKIKVDAERDRWFSATEAVEYGLVDHVISQSIETTGNGPMHPAR